MILIKKSLLPKCYLAMQGRYSMNTFQKIMFVIQRILNKMANEDNRTFANKIIERKENGII